jgi:hypothetical protein
MAPAEQLTIDRQAPVQHPWTTPSPASERAARETMRAQVAKLECELSGIVADGFPHVSPAPALPSAGWAGGRARTREGGREGPHLLTLAELERQRDRLALRLREAQEQTARRGDLEWRSRELLERMKLEPARYKFVRLPVVSLGERGCGVWEVRPRLGLIGMLAGWWQLKLSSGCPLPGGSRGARDPASSESPQRLSATASHSPRATSSIAASVRRWRSVIEPTVLVSDIGS